MAKTIRSAEEAAQYAMSQPGNSRRSYYEALLEDPNVQRGLGVIRATEGTAKEANPYATAFGGGQIKDLSRHPGKAHSFTWNGKPAKTTAAGAYQFLGRTWGATANKLGLTDFGPKNQDIAALSLIDQRGGLNHLLSGNLKGFVNKVGQEWASLPSSKYGQPTKSWNYVQNVWNNGGKALKGAASSAWNTVVTLPDQISVPSYRPDIATAANPNLADRPSMQATLAAGMASPGQSLHAATGPVMPASMQAPPSRPETYHGAPIGAVQRGGPLASIRDMLSAPSQARFAPELANPSRFAPEMPNPSRFALDVPNPSRFAPEMLSLPSTAPAPREKPGMFFGRTALMQPPAVQPSTTIAPMARPTIAAPIAPPSATLAGKQGLPPQAYAPTPQARPVIPQQVAQLAQLAQALPQQQTLVGMVAALLGRPNPGFIGQNQFPAAPPQAAQRAGGYAPGGSLTSNRSERGMRSISPAAAAAIGAGRAGLY